MQWQPIETAPKDGTPILICQVNLPRAFQVVRWLPGHEKWAIAYLGGKLIYFDADQPTHWMPLPEPPEPATGFPGGQTAMGAG